MTMTDAKKALRFFERELEKMDKDAGLAHHYGFSGTAVWLRKRRRYYRAAVKALREVTGKDDES